jgi:hypothetical protein
MAVFISILGCLLSAAGAYLTWKHAHFFLAKRDYYVHSKFDLLKKKLSMSISVAATILLLTLMAANAFTGNHGKKAQTPHTPSKTKQHKQAP